VRSRFFSPCFADIPPILHDLVPQEIERKRADPTAPHRLSCRVDDVEARTFEPLHLDLERRGSGGGRRDRSGMTSICRCARGRTGAPAQALPRRSAMHAETGEAIARA
jgi:hypothetical protein